MKRTATFLTGLILCLGLSACGTDSSSGDQDSGNASSAASTSVTLSSSSPLSSSGSSPRFSLQITDAPIDNLSKVIMLFTEVELRKTSGGWLRYTLDTPVEIDILQLHGTAAADLLKNVPVEAGDYNELRLIVGSGAMDNYVELVAGGTQPLQIPAGSSSGIKVKGDFTITSGLDSNLTLDIDLRQSIRSPGMSGNYQFKLVYRLVENSDVGHISGMVDPTLLAAATCSDLLDDTFNAAYVFDGHNVIPDDIDATAGNPEPVTTTSLHYDADMDKYVYEAAFLPAGDYTVAITCNADQEDLDADDDLQFFNTKNITVLVNDIVFL